MAERSDKGERITVRLALAEDADAISGLCEQLGYPTEVAAVRRRLEQLQQDDRHAVYVAELPSAGVIGWVHVYSCPLLEVDLQAEIGGLVVDKAHHRFGAGQLLMAHAEDWARQHGAWAVYLRSNVVRKEAHAFYQRIGYTAFKTSLAFRKELS